MNAQAAAVLTKPAFRKVNWLARDIDVARRLRRPGGAAVCRSAGPGCDGAELMVHRHSGARAAPADREPGIRSCFEHFGIPGSLAALLLAPRNDELPVLE
jgi:hypothetical protein